MYNSRTTSLQDYAYNAYSLVRYRTAYHSGSQVLQTHRMPTTSYYNGKQWNMTWTRGRQLETISDGTTTWTNTYSSDGLRTSRTDGTTTYTYVYDGDRLTGIQRNDLNMYIIYDANGPATIKYGSGTFHYVTNQQGDVIAIVNKSGERVVEYTYDAWGNVLSITGTFDYNLGIHNPILYRGYIYDHDTGLYYCQSRYYDPKVGRFLNADAFASTGQGVLGNNMFAYCGNNPAMYADPSGNAYKDARREAQYHCIEDGYGSAGGNSGVGGLGIIALGAAGITFITSAVIATYDSVTTFISSKTKTKSIAVARTEGESDYQYWVAYRVKNKVYTGSGLSFREASLRVASGYDIMCANDAAARWLLIVNGYWNHVGPEIHGGEGYYWHYHPNRNSHIHIWYL